MEASVLQVGQGGDLPGRAQIHSADGGAGSLLESEKRMAWWERGGQEYAMESHTLLLYGMPGGGRAFGKDGCTAALPGAGLDNGCQAWTAV